MNVVYNCLLRFPVSSGDEPVVKDEVVEEDNPWDLHDLTSKNKRGRSALPHIKALC